MKKLAALVLMVVALLGMTVAAKAAVEYEYITNYEEIRGVDWDNRHAAAEIKPGVAYRFSGDRGLYFKFCPNESRKYKITLIETNCHSAAFFLNSKGEQIGEKYYSDSQNDVILFFF